MDTTIKKAISTLQDLIAIDTVQSTPSEGAPFGMGNRKALDYTLDLLAKNGFFTHDVRGYCGWGEIGEGELFGILFHLDVVFFCNVIVFIGSVKNSGDEFYISPKFLTVHIFSKIFDNTKII